ncbi:MAG TPA: ATP synthase F0 subunit C [Candidatus Binatia bacterium]
MKTSLWFLTIAALWLVCLSSTATAAEAAAVTDSGAKVAIALASGLAIAIAAFGAALGQGKLAATAMESIGRNPNAADKLFTPLLLGLAFIEALAIYALLIAFLLQLKI